MKHLKTLLAGAVAASSIVAVPAAMADGVSGSVAVASTYLWRGYDLGSGTPAVSGDLSYSMSGAYVGIWGSSGDTTAGTEYDLYAGYGAEFSGVSVDLSVYNYNYPTGPMDAYTQGRTNFGDLSEAILSVGYGPVSVAYYNNIAGNPGYKYYTVGLTLGKYSATVGEHDNPHGDKPVHLDLSYAYTDNLSFTFSQFVSKAPQGDDLKFVVAYSIPIK